MKRFFTFFLLAILVISCKRSIPQASKKQAVLANHDMVVSARKEASQVGLEILKKGGNAFDAIIATEFALAVTYPFAGSLGGGGFMVYRTNHGETGALDYRR